MTPPAANKNSLFRVRQTQDTVAVVVLGRRGTLDGRDLLLAHLGEAQQEVFVIPFCSHLQRQRLAVMEASRDSQGRDAGEACQVDKGHGPAGVDHVVHAELESLGRDLRRLHARHGRHDCVVLFENAGESLHDARAVLLRAQIVDARDLLACAHEETDLASIGGAGDAMLRGGRHSKVVDLCAGGDKMG